MPEDNKETVQDAEELETGEFESLEDLPEYWQQELTRARSEAAQRRVELKSYKSKISDLEDSVKKLQNKEEVEEVDRLRSEYEELKTEKETLEAERERMRNEYRFVKLAAGMGVSPEVASLIDISKLDLDDEDALQEKLKAFTPKRISGGGPSNPATDGERETLSDAERKRKYFKSGGRGVDKAFGG